MTQQLNVPHLPLGQAASDILAERRRQIEEEGYTQYHDDQHDECEMALAAALYAIPYGNLGIEQYDYIELEMRLDVVAGWNVKPDRDYRQRLVKAGALIIAEIERIDRAKAAAGHHG